MEWRKDPTRVGPLTPDTKACVRQTVGSGKRAHDVGSQMIKLHLTYVGPRVG